MEREKKDGKAVVSNNLFLLEQSKLIACLHELCEAKNLYEGVFSNYEHGYIRIAAFTYQHEKPEAIFFCDLYLLSKKFHNHRTGERGSYTDVKTFVKSLFI